VYSEVAAATSLLSLMKNCGDELQGLSAMVDAPLLTLQPGHNYKLVLDK